MLDFFYKIPFLILKKQIKFHIFISIYKNPAYGNRIGSGFKDNCVFMVDFSTELCYTVE